MSTWKQHRSRFACASASWTPPHANEPLHSALHTPRYLSSRLHLFWQRAGATDNFRVLYHPTPSRLVFGVGPSDCSHFAALVRMSVLLVLPGLAGLEGKFPFEVGKALDGFSLFPREFEIDVLKLVVKADLAGVRESCAKIDPINARPIDGAHAHWAGRAIHVKIAAFEHLRAFGNWIGRALGTRNHLQISLIIIRALKGFGIDPSASVDNRSYLCVINRDTREKNAVLAPADDFAVLNDYRSARSSPAFFYRFDRKSRRFVEELLFVFVAFNVLCAHRILWRILWRILLRGLLGVLLGEVLGVRRSLPVSRWWMQDLFLQILRFVRR